MLVDFSNRNLLRLLHRLCKRKDDGGRFACAVLPDESHNAALWDTKTDVIEGKAVIRFAQVIDLYIPHIHSDVNSLLHLSKKYFA